MGYPWTCEQALKKKNESHLRLRNAQVGSYPPGSPYRQHREREKREADATAEKKCENVDIIPEAGQPSKKFFLKDRSDY
ncbi:MAG: hypothetical protein F6K16_29780 [Symploca sp. SIO2B6]|nr:hypothetical protein [Symploca sp. SIO2B6]